MKFAPFGLGVSLVAALNGCIFHHLWVTVLGLVGIVVFLGMTVRYVQGDMK